MLSCTRPGSACRSCEMAAKPGMYMSMANAPTAISRPRTTARRGRDWADNERPLAVWRVPQAGKHVDETSTRGRTHRQDNAPGVGEDGWQVSPAPVATLPVC